MGGNYQIFSEMLKRSSAKLRLGASGEVTGIVKFGSLAEVIDAGYLSSTQAEKHSKWIKEAGTKWWVGTKTGGGGLYDSVFIATPWHNADISLINTHATIPSPPYVHLHVTLLITNASHPNPAYFGRGKSDAVPTSILTTHAALRKAQKQNTEKQDKNSFSGSYLHFVDAAGLARPLRIYRYTKSFFASLILGWWPGGDDKDSGLLLEFNSLSYLRKLPERKLADGRLTGEEHVVKIFSKAALNDTQLESIMGTNNLRWVFRKQWDAYPELRPTRDFPPLQVDEGGLYFLNSFETLISTMETSTVSARNAVALLLQKTFGWDFVHGGKRCDWQKGEEMLTSDMSSRRKEDDDQEAWAGWGCNSG
ncbi:PCYOX1, FCLY [Ceraceosorus bombacis]|uniref:PCYOX1, FCLY n=2 Tax=Ceraceosorus bombacis TaxID=401625 RepID=A0A0P1BIT0_9BASI|nr:PCYOX1, FCLY [Ceraceosorus bombacis]